MLLGSYARSDAGDLPGFAPRIYPECGTLRDSTAILGTIPPSTASFTLEARGYLPDDRERRGPSPDSWGITWGDHRVCLTGRNTDFGDLSDRYVLDVEASRMAAGQWSPIIRRTMTHDIGAVCKPNTLIVEVYGDSLARIFAGSTLMRHVFNISLDSPATSSEWGLTASGRMIPEFIVAEYTPDPRSRLLTGWTADSLDTYLNDRRRDPSEGYWSYFDRRNDPDKGRIGGKYTIATVRNQSGGYDIIYVSGAAVNASGWSTGMLKGRLSPTIFPGHYDLLWVDAMMMEVSDETNATITNGALLEVSFPLYDTLIRFSRVPRSR